MSRWVYLLGVGIALVALALALTDWALSFQPGVTEANYRRIALGVAEADVVTLLGGSADPNPTNRGWLPTADEGFTDDRTALRLLHAPSKRWEGERDCIVVFFDERWRVVAKCHAVVVGKAARPGPLARLRAWLGW